MTDMHITWRTVLILLLSMGLIAMLFANGLIWKEMFVRAVAEHTDDIDGLIAAYFAICSGFGALTFLAWMCILVKARQYMKKKWGSDDDGGDNE